jgi:hypothetical protein
MKGSHLLWQRQKGRLWLGKCHDKIGHPLEWQIVAAKMTDSSRSKYGCIQDDVVLRTTNKAMSSTTNFFGERYYHVEVAPAVSKDRNVTW